MSSPSSTWKRRSRGESRGDRVRANRAEYFAGIMTDPRFAELVGGSAYLLFSRHSTGAQVSVRMSPFCFQLGRGSRQVMM